MLGALKLIREKLPAAKAKMVLPDPKLWCSSRNRSARIWKSRSANLPWALAEADVAIASTGTVTMECAFFGVPTVTLYKTSWLTYQIAKRIVTVKSLTMPNLLADETIYPEFVQDAATPENIAARRAGIVAGRIAPETNQSAARAKLFRRSANPARRTRGGGDFEFVQPRITKAQEIFHTKTFRL